MDKITVVIPAYNEAKGITKTILQIKKSVPNCNIIVVDDCSSDDTYKKAKAAKAKVIRHKKNKGYGAALKTGFNAAKTEYVAFLDADLTYHPKYIPIFLDTLKKKNLDIVWGNRFGGSRNKMPFIRKIGNKILVGCFMIITGKSVSDLSSGLRIFKKSLLKKIDCDSLPDGLNLTPAMTKRIVKRKIKFELVGMDYENRAGSSKLNIAKDFIRMLRSIIMES